MKTSAWRHYLSYYKESIRVLPIVLVAAIGQAFILFPMGLLFRHLFDDAIPNHDLLQIALAGVAVVLLYVSSDAVTVALRFGALRVTKLVTRRLREELVGKVYTFPRSLHSHTDLSKLHASIVQDTERVDVMSNLFTAQLLPAVVSALVLGIALAILNWLLFLVMLAFAPVLYLLNRVIGGKLRAKAQVYNRSFETFSKGILFVLQLMDLTRTQAAERFETERQSKFIDELRVAGEVTSRFQVIYVSLHRIVILTSSVVVLAVGGILVSRGSMTIGELIAFYVVAAIMKDYLITISSTVPQVIAGRESVVTLHQVLSIEEKLPYSGTERLDFKGKITFDSVGFAYENIPTLEGVSLTIDPHSTIALIGPNGAGKSTLLSLALGFYRPQRGRLYADGRPYDDLDMVDLRRQIGVVPQDPLIFPGSIAENISYGSPGASEEEIVRAAKIAAAHDFIQLLDFGYATFVGENGVLLSGGQRQSIAIARALLKQPVLLILDEPTNHLDHSVIHQLMNNLKELIQAPTTILISHNLELVREAQQVYFLRGGRLIATGDPAVFFQAGEEWKHLIEEEEEPIR